MYQMSPHSVDETRPPKIKFVSLGLVVLDEIHFPARQIQKDILGGSGAYEAHQPSTRGCLEYLDESHDHKRFQYTTPTLDVIPEHLHGTPLLESSAFHLLAGPEEAITTVRDLLQLRHERGIHHRPLLIWEPRPSSCVSANLDSFRRAIAAVNVFSPNHIELGACFGYSFVGDVDLKLIEDLATTLYESVFPDDGRDIGRSVVIRAAEHGSLVVVAAHPSSSSSSSRVRKTWCPAFYQPGSKQHQSDNDDAAAAATTPPRNPNVVDPTGAGNAFLGGFAIGLQETSDPVRAARYGTVAASFALEQPGLPVLGEDHPRRSCGEEGEVWNGCGVFRRLEEYERRLDRNA
ncbi:MAG: hypothetical protein LQ344_004165 [Seirophora lacunosa]|nr:MAG: hypothetical protein LQ344_004165 [Seirophora lacunosa]